MIERRTTRAEVIEKGKIQKLCPTESQFKGKRGYRRYHVANIKGVEVEKPGEAPDGSYEWAYKCKTNNGGKRTREFGEVLESMTPFIKADTDRHLTMEGRRDRVILKDGNGHLQYLDPALAKRAAEQNGWSHASRAGGNPVRRGTRGLMLWRVWNGQWEATGKTTPGPFGKRCQTRGIQCDPDGFPWRFIKKHGWRRI